MSPESCQHIILDRHLCTEGAGGLTGTCNCNFLLTGLRWSLRKFSLINKLWRVGFNENNSTIEYFNKIHKLTSYPPGPRLKLNTLNYFRCKFQVTLCTFFWQFWHSPAGSGNSHGFAVFILTSRWMWPHYLLDSDVQRNNWNIFSTVIIWEKTKKTRIVWKLEKGLKAESLFPT